MYAKKVDTNHALIRDTFRELGASVFDTSSVGRGFPDLVVGCQNITALVEVKRTSKSKFTEEQLAFMANWKGGAVVRVETVEQAVSLINIMRKQNV